MQPHVHSRPSSVTSTSSADPSSHQVKTTSTTTSFKIPRKQPPKYSIQDNLRLAHHGPDATPPMPPGVKSKNPLEREGLLPQIPHATGFSASSGDMIHGFYAGEIDLIDPPNGLQVTPSNHSSTITVQPDCSSRNLGVLGSHVSSPNTPLNTPDKVAHYNSIDHAKPNAAPPLQIHPDGLSRRRSALLVEFRSFEQSERTALSNKTEPASRVASPNKDLGLLSPPQSSRFPPSSTLPSLREVRAESPRRFPRPQSIISPPSSQPPRYSRPRTIQKANTPKDRPGHVHGRHSSSSLASSFDMFTFTQAIAGSPEPSLPRSTSPTQPQTSLPSPNSVTSSPTQISRAISPTISSALKIRQRVSSLSPTSNPWKGAGGASRSPRGGSPANYSPSHGSLDGAVGKAVYMFNSFNAKSTPTEKPGGLLEGLFSPAKDDDTPRNNVTASKDTETPAQQAKEPIGANKENLVPRSSGLCLGGQDHPATLTKDAIHKRRLGKEECLQLGLELCRVMEVDNECLSLLKSCVAKFDQGQMRKESLFASVEELLKRSTQDSEVRARLLRRLVDVVDTELAQD
ncbi:hypothetical protein FRB97_005290 [Tulasnella sp. 331]|nr:hypothetical protein FRB97_005290 [Tulasnella sp. 331]KAG8890532.1 hypothetical protein FRB98_007879 [Tulasnella sp. 332]